MTFSVVIPLYNKEAEIARALKSVLEQTFPPFEIVVVDDGSTDSGAAVVEKIVAEAGTRMVTGVGAEAGRGTGTDARTGVPEIKLIRQKNQGVSAARNRGMAAARGDYFALLDADDEWRPGFLYEIASLVREFPDCGLYCTGFDIVNTDGRHPAHTLEKRGPVDDFFRASMSAYVSIPSASVIPRYAFGAVGGFPEGMSLGEDQYMWTKIARRYPVCFSPARLAVYYMAASNRSVAIYKPEKTDYSFKDFYRPDSAGNPDSADFWLDEYIARVSLGKAIVISAKGGTREGRDEERFFAYNRHSRRLWWRLRLLNRLPKLWRRSIHALYTGLAWRFTKKGL